MMPESAAGINVSGRDLIGETAAAKRRHSSSGVEVTVISDNGQNLSSSSPPPPPSSSSNSSSNKMTTDWWLVCEDVPRAEMALLQQSFEVVKQNIDRIVVATFTRLFDYHPDAFAVFVAHRVLPKTREEVEYSWETRRHGLRVMHTFERCLNRLDRPLEFAELVRQTAETHVQYGVQPLGLLSLLGCFKSAIIADLALPTTLPSPSSQNRQSPSPSCLLLTPTSSLTTPNFTGNSNVFEDIKAENNNNNNNNQRHHSSLEEEELLLRKTLAWTKFFRILGMAFVAEMLRIQEKQQQDGGSNKKPAIIRARSGPQSLDDDGVDKKQQSAMKPQFLSICNNNNNSNNNSSSSAMKTPSFAPSSLPTMNNSPAISSPSTFEHLWKGNKKQL